MIRVAVGDDDDEFRRALVDVLAPDPRFEVVVEAATGVGLAAVAVGARADLVLLDVRMPEGGEPAVRAIVAAAAEAGRDVAVVPVSAETGVRAVAAMVRAGAAGYLGKGRIGSALPDLLLRCLAGEVVLLVPRAEQIRSEIAAPNRPPGDGAAGRGA